MRFQCRAGAAPVKHNLGYWDLSQYLGFGPSAHSFIENVRFSNVSDVKTYVEAMERDTEGAGAFLGTTNALGSLAVDEFTKNAYRDNVAEYIFHRSAQERGHQLRALRNVSASSFGTFTAARATLIWNLSGRAARREDDAGIRLTLKGMNISNRVMELFV